MTITVSIVHVFLFLLLTSFIFTVILIKVKNYYSIQIIHMEAQFNALRFWVSTYFDKLPDSYKEKARFQLAEKIIEKTDYKIVKQWYKFLFHTTN